MSLSNELSIYQSKALRCAGRIIELERSIAAETDIDQQDRAQDEIEVQRAMMRAFDAMVSFLNCCIELQRQRSVATQAERFCKEA